MGLLRGLIDFGKYKFEPKTFTNVKEVVVGTRRPSRTGPSWDFETSITPMYGTKYLTPIRKLYLETDGTDITWENEAHAMVIRPRDLAGFRVQIMRDGTLSVTDMGD